MCHSTDSRPPAAPGAGGVASHRPLILVAAGGTELLAHEALPTRPSGAGIVLIPDVRGLHPYYVALAQRFAEAGLATVTIDYYGRTAGPGSGGVREDDFAFGEHMAAVTPEGMAADVAAGLAHLRTLTDGPVFTVGFCFGGGHSWRLSAAGLDLAGVIGFYGLPRHARDVVGSMEHPLLLLRAGADVATEPAEFAAFEADLAAAGVPFESHTYAGAPHSFFDRSTPEWAGACDDAWARLLAFTGRHGPAAAR